MQHHKSKTLEPKWNETKYCLVQEPSTQDLKVQVDDYDVVNLQACLRYMPVLALHDTHDCLPRPLPELRTHSALCREAAAVFAVATAASGAWGACCFVICYASNRTFHCVPVWLSSHGWSHVQIAV